MIEALQERDALKAEVELLKATPPAPQRTEQEPFTFAGLAITEIRLPKGMTSRFEGGVLIIEAAHGITKGGEA
jgi:hypothetical protein